MSERSQSKRVSETIKNSKNISPQKPNKVIEKELNQEIEAFPARHGKSFDRYYDKSLGNDRFLAGTPQYGPKDFNATVRDQDVNPLHAQQKAIHGYVYSNLNKSLNLPSQTHSQFPSLIDSQYYSQMNESQFRPRKWQTGLSDKLQTKQKYKSDPRKREEKIRRCLERQRIKSRIGFRIKLENQKILEKMRSGKGSPKPSSNASYMDT